MGLDQYITWTFQWMAKKSLHKFKGRERRVIANEAGNDSSSIMAIGKMSGWHLANIMSNK